MRRSILVAAAALAFLPGTSHAVVNATSAILKVYKAYVSENGNCTNPVLLVEAKNPGGDDFDMQSNPTIGEGAIPPKKYQCLIMEMSDKVRFRPAATEGSCTSGTEYTIYVCQNGSSTTSPTGVSTACSGTQSNGEDRVFVYVSRWSSATDGAVGHNAFAPPLSNGDSTKGLRMENEIDVTGGAGSFIFDLTGKITGGGATCDMNPPKFGFRNGT